MKLFIPLGLTWAGMAIGKDFIMNRGSTRNGIWGNAVGRHFYPANSVYTTPILLTSTVVVKDTHGVLDAEIVPLDPKRDELNESESDIDSSPVKWKARHGTLEKPQRMSEDEFRKRYTGCTEVKYIVGTMAALAALFGV